MKLNNFTNQYFLKLILFMIFVFSSVTAFATWQVPNTAPGNSASNLFIPFNTSSSSQQKNGALIIDEGFRTLGPALFSATVNPLRINVSGYGAGKVLTSDAYGFATWKVQSSGTAVSWGASSITGTLSNQTDLQNILNTKANLAGLNIFTGIPESVGSIPPLDNTNLIATTAFVKSVVSSVSNSGGGWTDQGNYVSLTNINDDLKIGDNSIFYKSDSIGVPAISERFINTYGSYNFFLGKEAGPSSGTISSHTVGIGDGSLRLLNGSNGQMTALGYQTLYNTGANAIGQMVAVGYKALFNNGNSGYYNSAVGSNSLYNNISGDTNTAIGYESLYANTSGNNNTGIGAYTLNTNQSGDANTAIGYYANVADLFTNSTVIGHNISVSNSNKIRIGNPDNDADPNNGGATAIIEGQVAYSTPSDLRLKENINDIDLGLEFIKKLRPVSYTLKGGKGTDYGFIAQEVETAIGKDTNLVLTDNTDFRGKTMRYTELIAPLTKAIQEQQEEIEEYKKQIENYEKRVEILEELKKKN